MKKHYGGIQKEVPRSVRKEVEINGEKMIFVNTVKYRGDLFYVAPFYHTEIPESIKKVIVIDIDLDFRYIVIKIQNYILFYIIL